ncbi:hypothetical protein HMPREF1984_00834 [Leptotrichia sp. oral taxon 215 str. W9775]|nr:hypothetical protein HMPREF1984_00834 [Leptotrichia sp. oral taxon 215 str. W9775]
MEFPKVSKVSKNIGINKKSKKIKSNILYIKEYNGENGKTFC